MLRNRIWYELEQAKFATIYLSKYINWQSQRKKLFDIATLIFSSSGALGWKVWDYAPLLASIIISFMQILKLVKNQMIIDDKELQKIEELRLLYLNYFHELEKLWYLLETGKADENETSDLFLSELSNQYRQIQKFEGNVYVREISNLDKKAEEETKQFIKNVYY